MSTVVAAKGLAYDTLSVSAECADPTHLDWLEEFLAPAFAPRDVADADCHVELAIDADRFAAIEQPGADPAGRAHDCFVLDTNVVRLPAWASPRNDTVVFDDRARVFYVVSADRRRVHLVSDKPHPAQRTALMRVVREFAMSQAWTRTRAVIHGAAFVLGDTGFVITGPKGAGKTSLLIHALQTTGAQFVANDRVVVDVSGAAPAMHGMPTIVTIRPHTLELFPELRPAVLDAGYSWLLSLHEARERRPAAPLGESVSLTSAQLCAILQVTPRAGGRLHAILFPRLTAEHDGILVRECSAEIAVQRLLQGMFAAGSSRKISGVFALDSSAATEVAPAQLERFCRMLAGQVRCFECELGPGAYRNASALSTNLDRILHRRANVNPSHT